MDVKIRSIKVIFILLFCGMFLVTNGLAVYRNAVQNERGSFQVSLPSTTSETSVSIDIAQQGLPKRLLQPGMITISSGHGGGIRNSSGDELNINVKLEGFSCEVQMTSSDQDFDVHSGVLHRLLKPGEAFSMGIDLNIPRAKLKTVDIANGNILFINSDSKEILAKVPVSVINSKAVKQ